MLRQSLECLVRVSLAKMLGRVSQAEGTAWAKHGGMPQRSQGRWGSRAVQADERGNGGNETGGHWALSTALG